MVQGSKLVGLFNATDDYDAREQLVFEILQGPPNGALDVLMGSFTYQPDPMFWGSFTILFKVCCWRPIATTAYQKPGITHPPVARRVGAAIRGNHLAR